jgi:hypothetical protein
MLIIGESHLAMREYDFRKGQVGNDLNPQFIFSSGQRRATGLAFLLSINLSLAWSFRAIHLAEAIAQLCASGRRLRLSSYLRFWCSAMADEG